MVRIPTFPRRLLLFLVGCVALGGPNAASSGQEFGALGEQYDNDPIETDRDSFTPAVSTVEVGRTVVEAAYSFIVNRNTPVTHSVPELLVRRGLSDWFELRLGWNWEAGGPGAPTSGEEFGGQDFVSETEGRFLYGAKIQTTRQRGWLPESIAIVHADTPTNGPAPATTLVLAEAFGWTSDDGWQWNSAMRFGTAYEEAGYFNNWAPSSVLKIPIGERWNVHTEYFGIMSSQRAVNFSQHFLSFGGHFLLTPDFEIGLRFGFGLNEQTPKFFNTVGMGVLF